MGGPGSRSTGRDLHGAGHGGADRARRRGRGADHDHVGDHRHPQGKVRTDTAAGPIRVQQDGKWVPVDTTLVREGDAIVPKAVVGERSFSDGGDAFNAEDALRALVVDLIEDYIDDERPRSVQELVDAAVQDRIAAITDRILDTLRAAVVPS